MRETPASKLHLVQLGLHPAAEGQKLRIVETLRIPLPHLSQQGLRFLDLHEKTVVPLYQPGLILCGPKHGFRTEERVPHRLAADAVVFRDLSQGEVFVIIEVGVFPLLLREQFPVKIQQEG